MRLDAFVRHSRMNNPTRHELTSRIAARLETHKHCTVFENDLSQFFPSAEKEREKRYAAIRAYAKRHGWHATIRDPGVRVTFHKLDNFTAAAPAASRG